MWTRMLNGIEASSRYVVGLIWACIVGCIALQLAACGDVTADSRPSGQPFGSAIFSSGNPNGKLTGPKGQLAVNRINGNVYQNTNGAKTWVLFAPAGGGGAGITDIIAGDGMTGGGDTGAITLDAVCEPGLVCNEDSLALRDNCLPGDPLILAPNPSEGGDLQWQCANDVTAAYRLQRYTVATTNGGLEVTMDDTDTTARKAFVNLQPCALNQVLKATGSNTWGCAAASSAAPFSSGGDGSLDFDGTTTVLGLAPSAGVYTMNRDIYPTDMRVRTGVVLNTNAYQVLGTGNGLVEGTGSVGCPGRPGVGATGGAGYAAGTLGASGTGGGGSTNIGGAGVNVVVNVLGTQNTGGGAGAILANGDNGGIGRGGGGGGGQSAPGGASGTTSNVLATGGDIGRFAQAMSGRTLSGTAFGGGSGGGGGGGDNTNSGGGGGGGGCGVILAFNGTLTAPAGAITARGGAGASAAAGNAAGGGAGGSGWIVTAAASASPSVDVGPSAGGVGHGTAAIFAGGSSPATRAIHFDLR